MNFYEILKLKVWGRGSSDYWSQLFAEHVGGTNIWKIAELTGTLPLSFISNSSRLLNYKIYGTESGSGAKTKNLFNIDDTIGDQITVSGNSFTKGPSGYWYDIFSHSTGCSSPVKVDRSMRLLAGTYSISATSVTPDSTTFLIVYVDDQGENQKVIETINLKNAKAFTLDENGYISIRINQGTPTVSELMVYKGSTPLSVYIPYGYKLPLTITNGTETEATDIYIGDGKLGALEYVDYGTQKIYKSKRVHEDTVTIDGIEWDILGYNHDEVYKADGTKAKHTVTIQTHDCLDPLQFDAREALFAFPSGLSAGTYHFTVGQQPWYSEDVNKTIQFTLTKDVPANGVLVINNAYNATMIGATISRYARRTATIPTEMATMTEGSDGADLGIVNNSINADTNSIQRALFGNGNYRQSAIRQWLNSDKTAGSVWTPQNKWDRPPSWVSKTAGFLNGIDKDFLSAVGVAKKKTALNTVFEGGGTVETDERFFLLSTSEVYGGNEVTGGEGAAYPYYSDYSDLSAAGLGTDTNRIKYQNNSTQIIWTLRSVRTEYAYIVRYISISGNIQIGYANSTYGIAPACCIILDDMTDWVKQHFFTEVTPPLPLPSIPTYKGTNTIDSTEALGEVRIKGKIKPQI